MSATLQPWFAELKPYIRLEEYDRDGSARKPRIRIEISSCIPETLHPWILGLKMPCPACGDTISPVRARQAPNKRSKTQGQHLYFAATCGLDAKVGCSRGKAARDEYQAVIAAVRRL